MRIERHFFERDTVIVAKQLLGKTLVFESPQGRLAGNITEVEAYTQDEPACHAYNGMTPRNEVMFKEAGHLYIYFIYGMHFCANIVTETKGRGCAVLLRGLIPAEGKQTMVHNRGGKQKNIADGPAKLCQAFGWDLNFNGVDLCSDNAKIYVEESNVKIGEVIHTPRIGISQAQELEWRFITKLL